MVSPESSGAPVIVLIGPMGAGKSSVGKRVAKALGLRFTDTDSVIAQEHGPITQIFERRGEAAFRLIEHDTVRRALGGGGVVAVGGGAPLHPGTRAALASLPVVLLDVADEAVAGRIRGQKRPLLNREDRDPVEEWVRIREERRPVYESVATVRLDTSGRPMQAVVDEIVAWARGEGIVPGAREE
ncbi:shikimate kinase [Microbacterium sp. Marseille-Q6965]|uniref:shikimate kinase n=1 Tax=Microbacterium sp. Marseille-Q6965 TaxID=2965072 RepID=UPI0021B72B5B|nr:shikimate kinase [Microbacterium sp. Marseille-Q6965]